MNLSHQQVQEHIAIVHEGAPGWERSEAILLAEGNQIVPFLLEPIEIELSKSEGVLVISYKKLLRLASLLATFEDSRSLWPLLQLARRNHLNYKLFRQVLEAVTKRASSEDIQVLLELLARARPHWTKTALLMELQPIEIVWIATAVVQLVERDPKLELRAAIPLLKPHAFLPLEYIGFHKRLKAALKEESLPIPVVAPQTTKDLPIPRQEPESEK